MSIRATGVLPEAEASLSLEVMRILYSHRTLSADGQRVHIRELTDALRERGHDIAMAGPGDRQSAQERSHDAGTKVGFRNRMPAALYELAEYAYSFPAYRRLKRRCTETPPDILYERYNLYFHAGVWLQRRAGLPMILEVNAPLVEERARHGNLFWKRFAQRSEEAIWSAADIVLPVSAALAKRVSAAGVPDNKIAVIRNAVNRDYLVERNPNLIRERFRLCDKIILGFAGFVREWHGVDRAIRFMADKKRPELHLMIVGDGPVRPGLERLAADLGVSDDITITGVIAQDQVPDHIAAFDIALQPDVVDYASPLKLFEYMALGKAIIAPDQENIREIVTQGETALLFSNVSEGAFDKNLSHLVDDAQLRAQLGARARNEIIRQDYSWNGNASRIEAIATKLIEQKQ